MNVALAELPIGMSAKEVRPLLTGDLRRGVTNQNDDVRLIHWREVEISDLYNVTVLDVIAPHTVNRIPVPIARKTATGFCGDGPRLLCWGAESNPAAVGSDGERVARTQECDAAGHIAKALRDA